jgi:hypothetical protein
MELLEIPTCIGIATEKDSASGLLLDVFEYPNGRRDYRISDANFLYGVDFSKPISDTVIVSQ